MICEGSSRGDIERFDRFFWELREFTECGWELIVSSAVENEIYGGRDTVFLWDNGKSECTTQRERESVATELGDDKAYFCPELT